MRQSYYPTTDTIPTDSEGVPTMLGRQVRHGLRVGTIVHVGIFTEVEWVWWTVVLDVLLGWTLRFKRSPGGSR